MRLTKARVEKINKIKNVDYFAECLLKCFSNQEIEISNDFKEMKRGVAIRINRYISQISDCLLFNGQRLTIDECSRLRWVLHSAKNRALVLLSPNKYASFVDEICEETFEVCQSELSMCGKDYFRNFLCFIPEEIISSLVNAYEEKTLAIDNPKAVIDFIENSFFPNQQNHVFKISIKIEKLKV